MRAPRSLATLTAASVSIVSPDWTTRPLPVQVDGDHIGYTPMTFESVPGTLRALLPPTLPTDLLHAERTVPRRAWRRMLSWVGRRRPGERASTPEAREEIRR